MADNSLAEEYLSLVIDLLSSTTAVAVFYTLILILYCLSVRLCYAQLRDDQGKINRQPVCTWVFQTLLLICATLDVIVKNRLAQFIYIDSNTLFGGPRGPPAASVATLFSVDSLANIIENILILGVLVSPLRSFSYSRDCRRSRFSDMACTGRLERNAPRNALHCGIFISISHNCR
jgi:hypothetical protein